MSYTAFEGIATCEFDAYSEYEIAKMASLYVLKNRNLEECHEIFSYCDEGLEFSDNLEDMLNASGLIELFSSYLNLDDGQLTITVNSESADGNSNSMIWDFLINYLCEVQTSKVMEIRTVSDDSREGMSSDLFFYTQKGEFLSVNTLLDFYLTHNQI